MDNKIAASRRIQDAGLMSKAVADHYLDRHPEVVDAVLRLPDSNGLREALDAVVSLAADEDDSDTEDTEVFHG